MWDVFGKVEVGYIKEYKDILKNAGVDLNKAEAEWTGLRPY